MNNLIPLVDPFIRITLYIFIIYLVIEMFPISINKNVIRKSKRTLLDNVFETLGEANVFKSKQHYSMISSLIFLLSLLIFKKTGLNGIFTSFLFSLIPSFYLYLKFSKIRSDSSHEGISFLTVFITQYKISNCNIYIALEKTAEKIETMSIKNSILNLIYNLNLNQVEEGFNQMEFAVNTKWCRMFTIISKMAVNDGKDKTLAYEDLLKKLRYAKSNFEKENQENSQSFSFSLVIIPISYMCIMLFVIKFSDVGAIEVMKRQFTTVIGLKYFSYICYGSFLNIIIFILFKSRKLDI